MLKSDANSKGLSLARAKSKARFFGIASAILLVLILVVPVTIVKVFALLGIVVTGWLLLFHGSTAVSMTLEGKARKCFQVGVSLLVPGILSLYFIKDATSVDFVEIFGYLLSGWYLIPIGIIGYVSWIVADYLDDRNPFRGFLIAVAVLFVICFMGYQGICLGEYCEYTDIDEEAAKRAAQAGKYFGQFLVYVTVSYVSMLFKMYRRRTPNLPMEG